MSSSLTASFSPGQVRYGRDTDAIDGVVPSVAITVRSLDDLVSVVAEAKGSGLALIPTGAGSLLSIGNKPKAYDVRVSLSGMASVVERCPDDMTVSVETGVSIVRLNRLLAADGQRVALDPAADHETTVGGCVSTNTAGGLSYAYGTPRDLVLGLTVVDGCGRLLRTGSRVVKNVAGYDLPRLFVGSYGTLGIIGEVTLRTHPLPESAVTALFDFRDDADLDKARAAIFASELPLAAVDFDASRQNGWRLYCRIEGTASQVEYQVERLAALCRRRQSSLSDDWYSPIHPTPEAVVVIRSGVLPSQLTTVARELLDTSAAESLMLRVAGRTGDGLLRISTAYAEPEPALRLIRVVAARLNMVIERAPAVVKAANDVWGPRPATFELMRKIKRTFDPLGLMTPGRFVGGL